MFCLYGQYDHWLLAYTRYELGNTFMRIGKHNLARIEFDAALNGGKSEKDVVDYGIDDPNKKISMQNMLNLR